LGNFLKGVLTLAALFAWSCASSVPPVPTLSVEGIDPEVRDAVLMARSQAVAQPKNGQATGRFGMMLEANALYPPAALAYQRAIRLEPEEFAWQYYLALTLQKLSRMEEAVDTVTAALRIRPNYVPAVLKRGELLFKLGRFPESRATLESLLAQDPKSAATLYALARVRYAQEDLSSAEDFYRRACEAYPTFGAAYYGLAVAEKRLGHDTESAEDFKLAERYKTDSPEAGDPLLDQMLGLATGALNHILQAQQLVHQGAYQEASQLFREVLNRDPDDLDGLYGLLNLFYLAPQASQPSGEEVETLYARARQIAPQNPELYLYYGTALIRQNKYDGAATALNKAIELKPDYADAHLFLGVVLEQAKRPDQAIEHYRLALAAQPSFRPAQLQLGRILVNLGRDREAIPELLPALQVDDADTSMVMMFLAQAYANSGDLGKAREYLKQARARVQKTGPPDLLERIDQGLKQMGTPVQ
jgi:tetratricopeptide (TPR) repeat protein